MFPPITIEKTLGQLNETVEYVVGLSNYREEEKEERRMFKARSEVKRRGGE